MQIGKNTVVSIDYTLTNDAGEVIDTSSGREPLVYLHGVGGIIPGLEDALAGKQAGESLKVRVPPEQAYGPKDPKLVQGVPRQQFHGVPNIDVGMQFQAQTGAGTRIVTVVGVTPETVTVDANHPLAGQSLNFDVKVVEVREASEEELSHGHVHGPHGHH